MEINTSERYKCEECGANRGKAFFQKEGKTTSYCFACSTFTSDPLNGEKATIVESKKANHDQIIQSIRDEFPLKEIPGTKLSYDALKYFGFRVGLDPVNGEDVETVYAPREDEGKLVGWQGKRLNPTTNRGKFFNLLRTTSLDHEGNCLRRHKGGDFTGTIRAKSASDYKLVIVEGNFDLVAAHQMILESRKDTKYSDDTLAVVSTLDGAGSAAKSLVKQRNFIETFKEVVLAFDMDEVGQRASRECYELTLDWSVDVSIATLPLKDARDCLDKGKARQFVKAVLWNSKPPRPKGSESEAELVKLGMMKPIMGIELPWKATNDKIYGLQPGITTLGAGTGTGKTSLVVDITNHCIDKGLKPGLMLFEESSGGVMRLMVSPRVRVNLRNPRTQYRESEVKEWMEKTARSIQVSSSEVYLWRDIRSLILEWTIVHGVNPIILDPITKIVPSSSSEANEFLDMVMKDLSQLTLQYGFSVLVTSHLKAPTGGATHEEGARVREAQFTGSRSMIRYSIAILGLERNKQADGSQVKGIDPLLCEPNILCLRTLKNRIGGTTGPDYLKYNVNQMRILEI